MPNSERPSVALQSVSVASAVDCILNIPSYLQRFNLGGSWRPFWGILGPLGGALGACSGDLKADLGHDLEEDGVKAMIPTNIEKP